MHSIFYFFLLAALLIGCTGSKLTSGKTINNFSPTQAQLIQDKSNDSPMRVFKINNREDSILLRQPSETVTVNSNDPLLQHFVDRLYTTVRDSLSMGVGIAAPQVGILKRIIWVQRFDKEGFPFEVYLNPTIKQYSKKMQTCREGCLSIPERSDTLNSRAYAILIEYDKLDGTHHFEMIEDFTAVIFQHEIDHLNGILYIDHLERELAAVERKEE
ncbi:MAG: peptide deformylase [Bacteroidota bacterium]